MLGAVALSTRGFTALPATYTMSGESMVPAVGRGDWFLTRPPTGPTPRGRLVVFTLRLDDTLYHVLRRAVGLPGDTLVMRDGRLAVNGRLAPWPSRVIVPRADRALDGPIAGTTYHWGPIVVGADSLFVLSDTRDMVGWPDSRFFGAVPQSRVVGWYVVRLATGGLSP